MYPIDPLISCYEQSTVLGVLTNRVLSPGSISHCVCSTLIKSGRRPRTHSNRLRCLEMDLERWNGADLVGKALVFFSFSERDGSPETHVRGLRGWVAGEDESEGVRKEGLGCVGEGGLSS